jgi:hypothetical protein
MRRLFLSACVALATFTCLAVTAQPATAAPANLAGMWVFHGVDTSPKVVWGPTTLRVDGVFEQGENDWRVFQDQFGDPGTWKRTGLDSIAFQWGANGDGRCGTMFGHVVNADHINTEQRPGQMWCTSVSYPGGPKLKYDIGYWWMVRKTDPPTTSSAAGTVAGEYELSGTCPDSVWSLCQMTQVSTPPSQVIRLFADYRTSEGGIWFFAGEHRIFVHWTQGADSPQFSATINSRHDLIDGWGWSPGSSALGQPPQIDTWDMVGSPVARA